MGGEANRSAGPSGRGTRARRRLMRRRADVAQWGSSDAIKRPTPRRQRGPAGSAMRVRDARRRRSRVTHVRCPAPRPRRLWKARGSEGPRARFGAGRQPNCINVSRRVLLGRSAVGGAARRSWPGPARADESAHKSEGCRGFLAVGEVRVPVAGAGRRRPTPVSMGVRPQWAWPGPPSGCSKAPAIRRWAGAAAVVQDRAPLSRWQSWSAATTPRCAPFSARWSGRGTAGACEVSASLRGGAQGPRRPMACGGRGARGSAGPAAVRRVGDWCGTRDDCERTRQTWASTGSAPARPPPRTRTLRQTHRGAVGFLNGNAAEIPGG